MNERLPELLAAKLAGALPGPLVAARFESRPRLWRHYDAAPPDARPAAVLVLLYPHRGQWHLPLTLRPPHLPDHPGQISLPGGAVEPGESGRRAAIREFHEELGAEGEEIELLGRLSPLYVHASNFLITPFVGATAERPRLTPNPAEVERLLEVPLAHLFEEGNFSSHQREHQGEPYTAPHFVWQSYRIWGATCMILGELVTVLEDERL
jgi:8-oxo-dGTP pyrophosphatase MutT (NUDIX family)